MKELLLLLWCSLCDAASRTYKTYAAPGCAGAVTTDTYEVFSSQGSNTCFNAPGSAFSTIDQWCDEVSSKYYQAVFSGTACDGSSNQQAFPLGQCANPVTGAAEANGTVIVTCDFSASPPCFGRDTHAVLASGETILMASLRSGDYVYDGPGSITRVIVNQHKEAAHLSSRLLEIGHARGSISLTADHVLHVDGVFVPAREALVGSQLGNSTVRRVSVTTGAIVNPLTTSGLIMADGVLASTYPEWIAPYMLGRSTASASSLLSFLSPTTAQAYYDAHLERFFQASSPKLVRLMAVLPTPLVAPTFVTADIVIAAGFVAFWLGSWLSSSAVLVGLVIGLVSLVASLRPRK